MPWKRCKLRDNAVYVRVNAAGEPEVKDGRVDVKYKPSALAKVYRASAGNLESTGDPADDALIDIAEATQAEQAGQNAQAGRPGRPGKIAEGVPIKPGAPGTEDMVVVYTDGACTGNPGPAGIGVVIVDGKQRRELSEYLGQGTNNIAELTAIERALEAVLEQCHRPVVVHSDSSYSIGLLTKGWKAKANTELVERLRKLARSFSQLSFVKVKGHAGIPENERCDELARRAVSARR